MTIVKSKAQNGTLTVGAEPGTVSDISCQVLACRVVPAHTFGDTTETLCGDQSPAELTTEWTLKFKAISDFLVEDGWVAFALANTDTVLPFEFVPSDDPTAPTITGEVRVLAVEFGGDVAKQNDLEISWPVIGAPTPTWAP